ncbi:MULTISPECIES: DUF3667 domain-containing protein [Cupriavidus]|uniref:DUF3667 domain-containing protein n=1 Tax=Cupriavidus sp. DF5525 TaxID=3160989 RepID=UPI0003B0D7F4|nr:hypothetical protein N234_23340 [Ralstonia pickettii DTP0602]
MSANGTWTCPTCRRPVGTPFCPQCGEAPLAPRDLTMRGLLGNLLHALTSVDGKMVRTFWCLLRYPGSLTMSYLAGARKPYIAPIQLFLVANVFFFAVQSLTGANVFSSTLDSHMYQQDWSELARSMVAERLRVSHRSLESYGPVFNRAVVLNAKSLVVLMTIPFALLLSLVFAAKRKALMTHIVFSLHLYTFMLLLFSLAIVASALYARVGGPGLQDAMVDNVLTLIILAACGVYVYAAEARVFDVNGAGRVVSAVALTLAAGGIVIGYRFVLFLITLYST